MRRHDRDAVGWMRPRVAARETRSTWEFGSMKSLQRPSFFRMFDLLLEHDEPRLQTLALDS